MAIFIIILVIVVIIGGIAYSAYLAKKRREAMATLAQSLGLTYQAAKDYSIASSFGFLNKLAQGSNRYAYNIISGQYRGQSIMVFDYHYETYSTDSKGNRRTNHHYFSFFILRMSRSFPELVISKEGFFQRWRSFLDTMISISNLPNSQEILLFVLQTKNSLTISATPE